MLKIFRKKETEKESEIKKILKDGLGELVSTAYHEGVNARIDGSSMLGSIFGGAKDGSKDCYPSYYRFDREILQNKSVDAYFTNPRAKSAITRIVESSVADGLKIECKPSWDIIDNDWNEEEKEKFVKKVEKYFNLWASTKTFDVEGRLNFYAMQRAVEIRKKLQGEVFILIKYNTRVKDSLIPVQFQLLDTSRVCTPIGHQELPPGHRIVDGIEYNRKGEAIAYYYLKDDPAEALRPYESIRIPKYGPRSGKLYVIHTVNDETALYNRGLPFLTGVIHELQKISDYSVAEIQAAVVNASIVAWLKPSDLKDSSKPFTAVGVTKKTASETSSNLSGSTSSPQRFEFGDAGAFIQNLKAGEEIHSYDTKRPNINFGTFVDQVMQGVSSSLGIPITVLNQKFTDNYSASRAELLLFWNTVIQDRATLERDVLKDVYDIFFDALIDTGRIEVPNYYSSDAFIKLAWRHCSWIGLSLPSIDPLKEAKATSERLAQGLTTRDRESAKFNGSNYDDNVASLTRENEKLYNANRLLEAFTQIVDYVDPSDKDSDKIEQKEQEGKDADI